MKLQASQLFWRISANDSFCTALTPLTVTYPFTLYSALPSSLSLLLLLIYPTFVLVQIQKASKNLKLISHFCWSHFHRCYFLFLCFFCLSQLCFIFSCCCCHKKGSFKLRIDQNISAHINVIKICSC